MATREIETPEPPEKPMTTTPCPTCTYPARESDFHVVECGRCQAIAHEPCFWPALPIKKWLIYTRSREESVPPSTFDRGFICAACRQVEGLGEGRRLMAFRRSTVALASTASFILVGCAVTEGTLSVSWTAPTTNADGSPLTDLVTDRLDRLLPRPSGGHGCERAYAGIFEIMGVGHDS
jgi:hypothetical protein